MAEIAIMVAISAAISAASYTLQYFLTPKPKGQERGRLQGELQVQDSAYGSMIPLLYGGDPALYPAGECDPDAMTAAASDVDWTALDDVTLNVDNSLEKTGGVDGTFDASAHSSNTFAGDRCAVVPITLTSTDQNGTWYVAIETLAATSRYGLQFNMFGPSLIYRPIVDNIVDPENEFGSHGVPSYPIFWRLYYDGAGVIRLQLSGDGGTTYATVYTYSGLPTGSTYRIRTGLATSGVTVPPITWKAENTMASDLGGGGGNTVAGNVIYLSEVRPVVTETPAEGGKGGPSAPPTKTITYYCDIGIKFCEGRQLLQKLYADAEPLLDFTTGTTGLVNPDADPEPDYDNLTPIDPSDTSVATRRQTRYGEAVSYDDNGVLSGTLKDGSTFRFYQGTDTQPADPLYESYFQSMFPTQHAAGKVVTPTHKGDTLLFIQNFYVSNFGRIPSIRAKLSNADLYTADTIVDDLAQRVGLESSDLTLDDIVDLPVRGLPVFNRNGAADAIATLQLIHAFDLVDADGMLEAVARGGALAGTVLYDDLGSTDGDNEQDNDQPIRSESEINVDLSVLPARLDLSFLSASVDGESETVGFSRLETDAKVQDSQELNAVLRKDEAERVMRRLLDTIWAEARATRTFKVPHTYYQIKPGRAWQVPISQTASERVRITEVNGFLPGSFECKGVVESSRAHLQNQIVITGSAGDASGIIDGHSGAPPTLTVPNTSVATFIDRILRDRELQDGRPGYHVGARGFSADPWGGCTIKRDRGAGFERVIDLTEPATLGVIAVSPATLLDASTMDVDLYEGGTLPSFTADEVTGGQGFYIAGELVFQAQTATQLSTSPNRWQLSDISNIGARCSVNGSLAAGQRFALLNQAFRFVAIESEEIGVERNYIAQSSGQNEADCARIAFTCNAPNVAVVTPADWTMTAGNGTILHTWTPFSDECVMTEGLVYEVWDDASGSPGTLIFSGNSFPIVERDLPAGTYTRHFRARTRYADGAFLMDSVVVTVTANIARLVFEFGDGKNSTSLEADQTSRFPNLPAGTVIKSRIEGDAAGSAVVDIKTSTADPPSYSSICASAKPTLSTDQFAEDSTLPGWTTTITEGTKACAVLESVSGMKQVTVVLTIQKA